MAKLSDTISLDSFFEKNSKICGSRVAVALSGGPDSVCLLYLLNEIKEKYSLILTAAHLNHKIRADEAESDMQFCIKLCERLNIPLVCKEMDVKALINKGESLETAARRIRYEFFDELDCDYVATAHNSDDNAETVLLNILRGSGAKGAGGIPTIRGKYIRPLLEFSKKEILAYLKTIKADFVIDSTNNQNDYSRNKLRNLVFPIFSEINNSFKENINRFALLSKEDEDFLNSLAQENYNKALTEKGLNTNKLTELHPSILGRVLKLFFEANNLVFNKQTADILISAIVNKNSAKINIEGNLFVEYKRGVLFIVSPEKPTFAVKTEIVNNLLANNTIDCDKIVGQLKISVKRDGDKIKLKGRPTKELRRIYSEKNIEPSLRDLLPVAHDDCGVVWGYKIGIAERVLADEKSKNMMRIWVEENDNA